MAANDTSCTICPYFEVKPGQLDTFKKICERFVEKTQTESGCLYYGFSFKGNTVFCREGYKDAAALLVHLERVAPIIAEAMKISELARLEVHGPETELAKLRGPMADLSPQFFALEYGFRH